jgi:hypothetical protein
MMPDAPHRVLAFKCKVRSPMIVEVDRLLDHGSGLLQQLADPVYAQAVLFLEVFGCPGEGFFTKATRVPLQAHQAWSCRCEAD